MQHYKFYFLNPNNVISTAQDFTWPDDMAALAEADRLSRPHGIEVWAGSRKVGFVERKSHPNVDNTCAARSE
jgi:hypothetical protein